MNFIDATQDPWRPVVADDSDIYMPAYEPHQLLTQAQWDTVRATWPADLPVGLIVPNDTEIETLEPELPRFAALALQFPKWVDGRAYSQAHILRSRYRYAGEIRAVGDVLVDMLPMLRRTGFDAVVLRHDQDRAAAERALVFFPRHYQPDVAQATASSGGDAAAPSGGAAPTAAAAPAPAAPLTVSIQP